MSEQAPRRRLAAILAADVVGYSRLMERDEAGTLAALKVRRKEVLEPLVAKHQGRVFKVSGDGVLVEFASAVNAVQCAIDLQQGMAAANAGQLIDRHIVLRVGVNLGDIMVEGSDLYGDGVNIAARLEALADPGSVLVSQAVFSHVRGKTKLDFEDLGERNLKNIKEAVRVYKISVAAISAGKSGLPANPSIAILPFTNMSGDPEQEYFSDGITEDIITDLSRISSLFVAARNTAFTFKGKAVEVVEAARRLNVGYVLEGSVRKAGQRVRITVQLIDGQTGGHLWAERYDRDFGDIFALQDEISKNVVEALRIKLLPKELSAITTRSTTNVEAYECYLRGRAMLQETWNDRAKLNLARKIFERAAEMDPEYAKAYAGMADCDTLLWICGDIDVSFEIMLANASKALRLAPHLAEAHASKGLALYMSGHPKEAASSFEHAITLDPDLWVAHTLYAFSCRDTGRFEKAALLYGRAAELNPTDWLSQSMLAEVYTALGQPEFCKLAARKAMVRFETALVQNPDNAEALSQGAATLVYLGESAKAEEWAKRAIVLAPEIFGIRYNVACVHAVLGKPDAALEHLEYIYSHVPRARGWLLGEVRHDTQLESLRNRPDFQALVGRLEAATAEPT
jgi:adenylate cyclase